MLVYQRVMIEITQSHLDLPNPLTENFGAFDMESMGNSTIALFAKAPQVLKWVGKVTPNSSGTNSLVLFSELQDGINLYTLW